MRQQGVTLIQMLLALGLLGLLTHLGIPAYSAMSEGLQRQHAAQDLAKALRTTRSEALLRNSVVQLHALEGDWSKGWRMLLEQDSPTLLHEWRRNGQTMIVGNTPAARQVRFNGLGSPLRESDASLFGTLHICQRPEGLSHYQVVLSRTGRVSLRNELIDEQLCAASGSDQ